MATRLPLLASLLVLLAAAPARADSDFQLWNLVTATGRFGDTPARWYGELQPRFGTDATRLERLLLRTAVGWDLAPGVSLWLGYGWTPLFSPTFAHEHRPFQQLLFDSQLGPLQLVNRTRFEQRFIADTTGVSLRARHMLRGVWQPVADLPWFRLAAYDELFVNFNGVGSGPAQGFDQNRVFAGVNVKPAPYVNFEAGYIHNYVWRSGDDRVNHIAIVAAYFTP